MRNRRGNVAIEAAMWVLVLTTLVVSMVQFGKVTYLYYTLKKTVYAAASYLATQQGTDFCNPTADANVQSAIQFALTGATDGSGGPLIPELTPDMFQVTALCNDPASGLIQCVLNTCDGPGGGPRPDYIQVNLTNYNWRPRIPFLQIDPIPLRPSVVVPMGGVS